LRYDPDVKDILNISRDDGIISNIKYGDRLFPEIGEMLKIWILQTILDLEMIMLVLNLEGLVKAM